jgi:8-oxo-dGTP pyrophosphatase MutT (NUDIX family)
MSGTDHNNTPSTSTVPGAWKTLDRRLLVDRSPFARIYDDDVQLPDGHVIREFVRVELPDFVIAFVLTEDNRVVFVRQYRQAVSDFTLELPAGHIEEDEDLAIGAKREVREETGFESDDWQLLGRFVMDANRECGWANMYLARNARLTVQPDSGDLGDPTVEYISLDGLEQRWRAGEFVCAPTSLCIALAMAALKAQP